MSMYKPFKKLVTLTNRQYRILKEEATTKGIHMSELIRRILDDHVDHLQMRKILIKFKPTMRPMNEKLWDKIAREWFRSFL
jgi:hypothetical protein